MSPISPRSPSVVVLDYDPSWPTAFEAVQRELQAAVGHAVVAIDHIGSTAIPGLAAKPTVDVLIRVVDLDGVDDTFDNAMADTGFAGFGAFGIRGRRFYVRPADTDHLRVHVHVFPLWHRAAGDHLRFRDYLCAHPAQAARYGLLKRQLAAAYPDDIDTYTSGKASLVHQLLGQARHYFTRDY